MSGLSRLASAYVGGIALVGGALFVFAATHPMKWVVIVPVVVLIVAADVAPAILRTNQGRGAEVVMSAGFPIRMAAIVLTGPWGAVLATTISLFAVVPGGRPLVKRVFNTGQLMITVALSGLVYVGLGGRVGPMGAEGIAASVLPFAVAALVYYVVNNLLVLAIVMLTTKVRPRAAVRSFVAPFAATYLGYGTIGLLLPILWSEIGILAAVLALGPIFVARWAASQLVAEREAREGTLRAFARAVETKDYYTRGHSERVARLSELVGREAKLPEERVGLLRNAGMLHDIGKIRVPTQILRKAGPLTRDEFATIQLHPVYGQAMMRDVAFLDDVLPGILHHHERYDGGGYPMGLAGRDIPEFARVITVADAFDCMTSTRSYRSARSVDEALAELRRGKGTQFDPGVVELIEAVIEREGWEPHTMPAATEQARATQVAYDHDDPGRPIPVQDGMPEARPEPLEPEP
jgi:hypothetical protein